MKARNTNEKYRKIKDAEEEEVKKEIEGRISIKKKERMEREREERKGRESNDSCPNVISC